jgi:hypothetical protein
MTGREIALAHAHAVLEFEREIVTLRGRLADVQHDLAQHRGYAKQAEARHQETRDRLFNVEQLHREAQQVACGDGCCHEGLGYCNDCGEDTPFPCRTYRVANGEALYLATEDE